MVTPFPASDFYAELEAWTLDQIRAGQESISLMAEIRERSAGNWEIEKLTRAIIFDEVQIIEGLKGEAGRARAVCEESQRV
ncbi:MAG: hypothetical protein ABSB32_10255 [Thermodesulfobacteriota bacterium]|jgi:hypothetical protein